MVGIAYMNNMLNDGISFLTYKKFLTMLPEISHLQILYLLLRFIPQCKQLNWPMHLLLHLFKLLSLKRRVLL